jgi:hypothetical protein
MSLTTRRTAVLRIKNVFTARSYIFRTYATSGVNGSNWVPAQTPGENPLYDMALEVIQGDSDRLQTMLEQLAGQKQHPKREQLEILSQMNRPDILWNFERGQGRLLYIKMNDIDLEIMNSGHVKGGF